MDKDSEGSRPSRKLVWIVITAIVGTVISVIVAGLFEDEPSLHASTGFNRPTGRSVDGILLTNVSVHNDGAAMLNDVEIEVEISPGSEGFALVEPGVDEQGASANCLPQARTSDSSIVIAASCKYLNAGDFWGIQVWHKSLAGGAYVRVRGRGLSFFEAPRTDFEDIQRICRDFGMGWWDPQSSTMVESRYIPPYCTARFGIGEKN